MFLAKVLKMVSHHSLLVLSTVFFVSPPTFANLTTNPVSEKPLNCSKYTSCSVCTDEVKCYWCAPDSQCVTYPSAITPSTCAHNEWYWKQCVIPGYVLIIVVPALACLILFGCGCLIYCKCCRVSNKSWKKEEDRITQRKKDRQLKAEAKKSERRERTDALRMKYGLLKDDDEDPLFA